MKKDFEHTEVLDDEFVELMEDMEEIEEEEVPSKSMTKFYIQGFLYLFILVFLTGFSIRMMNETIAVQEASLDVEKTDLYEYIPVSFE